MHAYDVPRRQSCQPVPSLWSAQDLSAGPSATPIYDALYAEYVKSLRSLPGDRSGEEELGFTAFGNIAHSTGSYGGSYAGSYSAYSAGAHSARQGAGHVSQWQRVGPVGQQSTGMLHVPALPPGPRRGI
ncbi:hypothetical protein [Streptomyces sp. TRM68367]|uniref:hypothetical protein n=1 Tax=Streptomyces sp. TRM68367 TaxID=2758415 RepID=UPI00165B245C|nr:hypothetical protein [Streptomyces sp. TRM68367]MBC9728747.1 hypothetical protein [Streptomyces sp. TRM68367]